MSSNLSRYEHRCHTWYEAAIRNPSAVIFGQLHWSLDRVVSGASTSASTPADTDTDTTAEEETPALTSVITLSKALHDTVGNVIGVLAMDIKVMLTRHLLYSLFMLCVAVHATMIIV